MGAGTYCFRLGVSLKNRTTLVKEVFPKRLSSARTEQRTRPRTFSYVFISYGCSNDWAKKAANAELTQTWKALEAEEISRPIAHEEIVRRQADEFLAVVYYLDAAGDLDNATDRLFDYIDRLLHVGMFEIVNEILRQVQVQKLSTSLMRSLLTITLAAKRHLKDREEFFERVEKEMTDRRGTAITDRLLGRLA